MERREGRGLLMELADVDPAQERAFQVWYENARMPAIARVAGVLDARRHRRLDGTSPEFLAIYDLESPAVLSSDAFRTIVPLSAAPVPLTRADVHIYREIVPDIAAPDSAARTIGRGVSMARTDTRGMLIAPIDVVPSFEAEFDRWYELEHLADRAACPGFLTARRFLKVEGPATKFLAVYDLERPEVLDGPGYARIAQRTPWGFRVKEHWMGQPGRWVFREIAGL